MKRVALLLVLILIAGILLARLIVYYLSDPVRFPVRHIKITALYEHISRDQLAEKLTPFEKYSFFMFPTQQLQHVLRQYPWIEQASIHRHYPDSVSIRIQERQPLATWNGSFLTNDGTVFSDPGALSEALTLPHLIGPPQDLALVTHIYHKVSTILAQQHLTIRTLERRDNHAWEIKLTNGTLLKLGKQDMVTRVERFVRIFSVLTQPNKQLQVVDLRYPNALAVKYKPVILRHQV